MNALYIKKMETYHLIVLLVLGISISISTALTSIFAVLLLILFFFSGNYQTKFLLIKRFYIWPVILLLIIGFISILYSPLQLSEAFSWAMKFYKLLIIWAIAYFCWKYPQHINKLLSAFFIGVICNVIAIFINYYFLTPQSAISFSGATFPAAQSHFVTGFIFAIAAFMLFSMALTSTQKRYRYLYLILGIITICAELGLNTSRTGYLIEFSILAVGFFMKFRIKGIIAAAILIPIIFISFYQLSPNFQNRVGEAYKNTISYYDGSNTNTSVGIRLGFYHTALGIFEHKPQRLLYGCGTGAQTLCSTHFINQEIPKSERKYYRVINNPHNQYIYFLMQSGIIALVLFLWLLAAAFYYAKKLPSMEKNNLRIFIIAFAVGCLVNSWILDIGPGFIFCYLLPVLAAKIYPNGNYQNI